VSVRGAHRDSVDGDAFDDACSALEAEFYSGEDELRRLLVIYAENREQ
jgi:hypothetical protein